MSYNTVTKRAPKHGICGFLKLCWLSGLVLRAVEGTRELGSDQLEHSSDVIDDHVDAECLRGQVCARVAAARQPHAAVLDHDDIEAVERGWATRAFPAEELEAKTLEMAQRMAALPPDIVQLNKRAVHRQMDSMGLRQGIRQGTELCSLAIHQPSFQAFINQTM